ncbi:hypothetical protein KFE25_009806 [Diacronema lutheri]|uniref:Plastid lipid-associated protein/fibrillin conserved domain-containing protein n=1 Tax=Diacronema lutheri TaxID=2081491 RepID=A0A8J5X6U2_DIALT|nr:hypothetical protein KFE25_009806 [Diacronema lutheri]
MSASFYATFLAALGATGARTAVSARAALLEAVAGTRAGLTANAACRAEVFRLVSELAESSAEPAPLTSPRLAGSWRLLFTDAPEVHGADGPAWRRPWGEPVQIIDTSAEPWLFQHAEGPPLFATATAQLLPLADAPGRAADVVLLERASLGGLWSEPPPAGAAGLGTVECVYLDDSLLISRGGGGRVFVLERVGALRPLPRVRRAGVAYYQGAQYFAGMVSGSGAPAPSTPAPGATAKATRAKALDNLTPNLKAAGMATATLGALIAGFLGSNGLLPGQGGGFSGP